MAAGIIVFVRAPGVDAPAPVEVDAGATGAELQEAALQACGRTHGRVVFQGTEISGDAPVADLGLCNEAVVEVMNTATPWEPLESPADADNAVRVEEDGFVLRPGVKQGRVGGVSLRGPRPLPASGTFSWGFRLEVPHNHWIILGICSDQYSGYRSYGFNQGEAWTINLGTGCYYEQTRKCGEDADAKSMRHAPAGSEFHFDWGAADRSLRLRRITDGVTTEVVLYRGLPGGTFWPLVGFMDNDHSVIRVIA
eukprot:TRINITY_DN34010_c0_g1_i1.p1 TRINITY_DN34010_c0_g1~~TRINITY_DN34010_c0_g1_i1.p1  ORF type:complete len:252 (+),score=4.14 TRINITY_DN34010_c0_g1_i1:99-854(+)